MGCPEGSAVSPRANTETADECPAKNFRAPEATGIGNFFQT